MTTFALMIPIALWANESKDLSQLLKESKCIPHRSKSGVVSYKCDGTLGAELRAQRIRQSRSIASENTTGQRKVIYSSTTDEKIKSCLSSIYLNQISHHRTNGKYTKTTEDMGVDRNETCNGLYIYTNVANEKEFKITAQYGKTVWTVDQTMNLVKVR